METIGLAAISVGLGLRWGLWLGLVTAGLGLAVIAVALDGERPDRRRTRDAS